MEVIKLSNRVQKVAQRVQDLLEKAHRCPDSPETLQVLPWNEGWNQFNKPRGK